MGFALQMHWHKLGRISSSVILVKNFLKKVCPFLRPKNYRVEGFLLNVANSLATEEIAEQVEGQLGPVDILVANAGIAGLDTC